MALIWMDGFDHYNGLRANIDRRYSFANSTEPVLSAVNPRTGTYCLYHPSVNTRTVTYGVGGSRTVLGVGCGLYLTSLPLSQIELFRVRGAGSTDYVASVWALSSGAIRVTRANVATSNQIGSDSVATIPLDAYFHIELRAELTGGNVVVELRLNGNTVITGSVADGGVTQISTLIFNFAQIGQRLDDLFIWDTSGSTNNTFLGAKRVITLLPSADTATANWTGTYTDIQADDGDTTTITAGTSTPVVSEFELDNLPSGVAGISAVQTVFIAKTDSVGSAEVQASVVSGASASAGTNYLMDTTYNGFYDMHEVDPNTSSAWTVSGVNAAKLRLSRTA